MRNLCFLFLLLLAGCGTDSAQQVLAPGSVAPTGPNYNGMIATRVRLNEYYQGQVEVADLQGRRLFQKGTDHRGWSFFRGQLPPDFRVTARRGPDVYTREIRGGWFGGTIYVNEATSLVSAYLKAHPELSLPEAERRVHDYYKLPERYQLSWLNVVKTSSFDSAAFYRGMAAAGSLEAYLDSLVREIDGRLALGVVADTGLKLLGAAGSALFSQTVNDAAGSVISKMGYNFTVSGALNNIESQLTGISEELLGFQNEVKTYAATAAVQSSLNNIAGNVTVLNTTTADIASNVTAYMATHGGQGQPAYNAPSGANLDITNAASQLAGLNIQEQSNSIVDVLLGLGQTSIYQLFVNAQMADMEISSKNYQGYPWRMNSLTDQQSALVSQLVDSLCQAGNLLCEYANLQLPLAASALQASAQVATLQAQIQAANQFIPADMASDEVILDLENGDINGDMMWYNAFLAQQNYADALDAAGQMELGPYGQFTLASQDEVNTLITNRIIKATSNPSLSGSGWDDSDTSNWTNAFNALGFDTTEYTQYDDPGNPNRSNDEGTWFHVNSGSSDNIYFWNNTNNNPSTSSTSTDTDSTSLSSYIVVRYYPGDAEIYGETSPFVGATLDGGITVTSASQTAQGTQLKAQMQIAQGQQTVGTLNDVTQKVLWTSSNSEVASVSNLPPTTPSPGASPIAVPYPPGPSGFVTWHPRISGSPLPSVTFTAQLYGVPTGSVSTTSNATGSRTLSPPTGLAPSLKQVQVLPVNLSYDLLSVTNVTQLFYLTAYYVDGTIQDVSTDANTTWTLTDANGQVLNSTSVGGFGLISNGGKNLCYLTSNITTATVSVTGTYNGPFGSASSSGQLGLQLLLAPSPTPTPAPAPSITNLIPAAGSSGQTVTILGANLTGATSVTFGGVDAGFFTVNTSEQITCSVPTNAPSGNVQLVVTTPGGSATATFTVTN